MEPGAKAPWTNMKIMRVNFDAFVKATMCVGVDDPAECETLCADIDVPEKVRNAVNSLDVEWDFDADPFDFPDLARGLTILADGTVYVVGTIPGMRGGRMYTAWKGRLP